MIVLVILQKTNNCISQNNHTSFFLYKLGGVRNRTSPIEKLQTESTQTETAKNRIWFRCNRIIFLLNRMVWFGLWFSFYQPNQIKPNRKIKKILIKHMSPKPILFL